MTTSRIIRILAARHPDAHDGRELRHIAADVQRMEEALNAMVSDAREDDAGYQDALRHISEPVAELVP